MNLQDCFLRIKKNIIIMLFFQLKEMQKLSIETWDGYKHIPLKKSLRKAKNWRSNYFQWSQLFSIEKNR